MNKKSPKSCNSHQTNRSCLLRCNLVKLIIVGQIYIGEKEFVLWIAEKNQTWHFYSLQLWHFYTILWHWFPPRVFGPPGGCPGKNCLESRHCVWTHCLPSQRGRRSSPSDIQSNSDLLSRNSSFNSELKVCHGIPDFGGQNEAVWVRLSGSSLLSC